MGAPAPVHVHGGAGGITAACDEIDALARAFGAAATDCLGSAWTLHGYLVDPALTCSALLDPAGYAVVEADLLDALDGLHGLSWLGMRCGVLDGELRMAAAAYAGADHLYEQMHDAVVGVLDAPAALADAAATLAHTGSPIAAAQSAITDDPEAADTVIHALGLPAAIYTLALALPDGHGIADPVGLDSGGSAGVPPRRLADVVDELGRRDYDTHHGAIDVRVLTLPDGSRRVIVDITGTKSWTPGPTADVTSLTTNGRALVGIPTAYEHGVLAAMRQAEVRRDDPVMLVGHSQGGMVAVEAARDASASGEFRITHVVTAGSPIGLTVGALPRRVQVLALENERDLVPHLDGVANPDEPNITTVSAAHGDGTVVGDHDIEQDYVPLATDAQASGNFSVRTFLHSARDFFRGVEVRTHTFQVTRSY